MSSISRYPRKNLKFKIIAGSLFQFYPNQYKIRTRHTGEKKSLPVTDHLKYKNENFQMLLTNRFTPLTNLTEDTATNVTDLNDRIVTILTDTAKEVAGTVRKPRVDKLSSTTRQLMERRRQMKKLKLLYRRKVECVSHYSLDS